MRALVVAAALVVVAAQVQASAPDLGGVLALAGSRGLAHACPVAPELALTSEHVVGPEFAPFVWEGSGVVGVLGGRGLTVRDLFRDLAFVRPYKSVFPRFYPIAAASPAVGERVWFLGYDFRKREDAMAPRPFDARVVRTRAGHLVMDRAGAPGASGSCVLNERGEVVAIHRGVHGLDNRPLEDGVGYAVGVWAPLLELGK